MNPGMWIVIVIIALVLIAAVGAAVVSASRRSSHTPHPNAKGQDSQREDNQHPDDAGGTITTEKLDDAWPSPEPAGGSHLIGTDGLGERAAYRHATEHGYDDGRDVSN